MSDPVIQSLRARRIWDSRGRPTVEAEVVSATAPSAGASRRPAPRAEAARRSRSATAVAARRLRRAGRARRDSRRNRAALVGARPLRSGRHRPGLVALDGTANLSRLGGNATDRRFARRAARGGGEPRAAALAPSPRRRRRRSFRCRRSRSSAAARMPAGAPTCRTSWSSRRAPRASPRRWR